MKSKLVYLCSSMSWGGLEMNQLRNAGWMAARGHDVLIVACINSPFLLQAQKMNLPVAIIQRYRKYYAFLSAINLSKLLRKEHATHLFIRDTRDMSMAATLRFLLGKKIKTVYFMEMQLGVSKKNILHTVRFSYIDYWSCPLEGLVRQVKEKTRFPHHKIVYLPSGLELTKLQTIERSIARAKLDLPSDKIIVGLIGRFDAQKGQKLLLDALMLCPMNDFDVVFVGESTLNESKSYENLLRDCIVENGIVDRVHFRPFMEDVSVFFSAIDWMVMATKAETFGMVSIESMACGTPVLGSNAGGTPELLKEGELGVLFESLNANDLAEKLFEIVSGKHTINSHDLRQHVRQFDHLTVCTRVEERFINH